MKQYYEVTRDGEWIAVPDGAKVLTREEVEKALRGLLMHGSRPRMLDELFGDTP